MAIATLGRTDIGAWMTTRKCFGTTFLAQIRLQILGALHTACMLTVRKVAYHWHLTIPTFFIALLHALVVLLAASVVPCARFVALVLQVVRIVMCVAPEHATMPTRQTFLTWMGATKCFYFGMTWFHDFVAACWQFSLDFYRALIRFRIYKAVQVHGVFAWKFAIHKCPAVTTILPAGLPAHVPQHTSVRYPVTRLEASVVHMLSVSDMTHTFAIMSTNQKGSTKLGAASFWHLVEVFSSGNAGELSRMYLASQS